MRHADAATKTEASSALKAKELRPLSETEIKRNALWDAFDSLK